MKKKPGILTVLFILGMVLLPGSTRPIAGSLSHSFQLPRYEKFLLANGLT